MDSPPPPPYTIVTQSDPKSGIKSASRLARTSNQDPPPTLSLDIVTYSPTNTTNNNTRSLHDLLLLSPSPAASKKSKTKNRFVNTGSPRNGRRSRRRIDLEIRDDKDFICGEDLLLANNKMKKRRHTGKSKKEKSASIPSPSMKENPIFFDRIGLLLHDLIMWNDVAKSTLWFGFGSLCFLSSCFTTGISFSIVSSISQLGFLCLVASFFSNTIAQRNGNERKTEFKLKEDDILKAARVVLPVLNFVILKARQLFSGEPSMTLKVAPLLLLGSEYGHIVTFKRFCALGFFIGFTGPKVYSLYSNQIHKKGYYLKERILEAWEGCCHKKIVAASVVTAFWNLTSIKTRIFAAFICLVIFRWYRQQLPYKVNEEEKGQQQEKRLTLVENMKVD